MDELEWLRRANPVVAADLDELVAVDRDCLVQALQTSGTRPRRASRRPSRATSASALAAAVILAFVVFAVGFQRNDESFIEASVVSPIVNSGDLSAERFDRSVDLLAVHLDYVDRADGHAAVAALEVTSWFDLEPLVVAGTQSPDSDRMVHEYVSMMDSAWDDRWLDASQDRSGAVRSSVNRWLSAFDAGGTVWVAEGGVSDFTADIIRQLQQQRPGVDTATLVRVVQQSNAGEANTQPRDLAFVQLNSTYVRIDPGSAANQTADLARSTGGFEAAVDTGRHAARWADAFAYLAADELDFADTVSVLHIVGVGVEHVANPSDFTDFFIGDQPDAALRGSS